MRNLGLPTTRGRFSSRSCGVDSMKLSRGASFHAAVLKQSMEIGKRQYMPEHSTMGADIWEPVSVGLHPRPIAQAPQPRLVNSAY